MGSLQTIQFPNNAVVLKDGHAITSSMTVAEVFGKQHKDVLRAIKNLDCTEEFNRRNFAPVTYVDGKGEPRPAFDIQKNGVLFLTMGFSGPVAAKIKEDYIRAFDMMEEALRQPPEPPRETITMDKLEAENLKLRLENAEMKLTMLTGKPIPKRRAWKQDELARMITLTRQGFKAIEIGEKLGRSHDSVETKQRELKQKGML